VSGVSLNGNLEDLGVGEILQILSLSRKSGVLRLAGEGKELQIWIREGVVVVVRPLPLIPSLVAFFQGNPLDPSLKNRIYEVLKKKAFRKESWVPFFSKEFNLPPGEAKELATQYMVHLVGEAWGWGKGSFSFQLLEPRDERFYRTLYFPFFPSVEEGVPIQFLAMEIARIQDESSSSKYEFPSRSPSLYPSPPFRVAVEPFTLLYVDEREDVLNKVGELLREKGYTVAIAGSVEQALSIVEQGEGLSFVVLTHLFIPRRDRSGFKGGVELAELLRDHPRVRKLFFVADSLPEEVQDFLSELKVEGVIPRPSRKDWLSAFEETAKRFVSQIEEAVGPPPREEKEEKEEWRNIEEVDPEDPLSALFSSGEDFLSFQPPRTKQGVELLRRMVGELLSPSQEPEVTLLVLRFASHFFQRAILFLVVGKLLRGLGQVGLLGGDPQRLVRELEIPLEKGSIFDGVVGERRVFVGKPPVHPIHHRLFTRLGPPIPLEVFAGPIVVSGKVVAVLYGDTVPTQTPIRDVETLEVFLAQAGLALERAYLRKMLLKEGGKKE